jgi:hypothetical protein
VKALYRGLNETHTKSSRGNGFMEKIKRWI